MISEVVEEVVKVGFEVAGEVGALSAELGRVSGFKLGAFVVTVLLGDGCVVALVVEDFVADELFHLGEDVLVSLED